MSPPCNYSLLLPTTTVVVAVAVAVVAASFFPPASAQLACTAASIISLAPCIDFLSGNYFPLMPSPRCCSHLEKASKMEADCLCASLRSSMPVGVTINETRVLSLPGACDIKTPPIDRCLSGPHVEEDVKPPESAPSPVIVRPPVAPPPRTAPTSPEVPPEISEEPNSSNASSPGNKRSLFMLLLVTSLAPTFISA